MVAPNLSLGWTSSRPIPYIHWQPYGIPVSIMANDASTMMKMVSLYRGFGNEDTTTLFLAGALSTYSA